MDDPLLEEFVKYLSIFHPEKFPFVIVKWFMFCAVSDLAIV